MHAPAKQFVAVDPDQPGEPAGREERALLESPSHHVQAAGLPCLSLFGRES